MKSKGFYRHYIKHPMDFGVALVLCLLLSPVLLGIAIAIRLESEGPAIFLQQRLGLNRKKFTIYKFRSMIQNAADVGPAFTSKNDSRVTKTGAFLRRTSLDELPQLFNVLNGSMSFVGPRPDVHALTQPSAEYEARFLVRPGITGLAQISGRSTISTENRIRLDKRYAEEVSFRGDIAIIMKTVVYALRRESTN